MKEKGEEKNKLKSMKEVFREKEQSTSPQRLIHCLFKIVFLNF